MTFEVLGSHSYSQLFDVLFLNNTYKAEWFTTDWHDNDKQNIEVFKKCCSC